MTTITPTGSRNTPVPDSLKRMSLSRSRRLTDTFAKSAIWLSC